MKYISTQVTANGVFHWILFKDFDWFTSSMPPEIRLISGLQETSQIPVKLLA